MTSKSEKRSGIILNTRPPIYRDRFHTAFAAIGLPIVDCPALATSASGHAVPDAADFDAVIFTSQVGVGSFPPRPDWTSKRIYAVGPGTEDAAVQAGYANVVRTGLNAKDMVEKLWHEDFRKALYVSGEDVTTDLSVEMPGRVQRFIAYRTAPNSELPSQAMLPIKSSAVAIAPLFSRRSAQAFAGMLDGADVTAEIAAVGISDDVFANGEGPWHCRAAADAPTLESMVTKVREVAKDMNLTAEDAP